MDIPWLDGCSGQALGWTNAGEAREQGRKEGRGCSWLQWCEGVHVGMPHVAYA